MCIHLRLRLVPARLHRSRRPLMGRGVPRERCVMLLPLFASAGGGSRVLHARLLRGWVDVVARRRVPFVSPPGIRHRQPATGRGGGGPLPHRGGAGVAPAGVLARVRDVLLAALPVGRPRLGAMPGVVVPGGRAVRGMRRHPGEGRREGGRHTGDVVRVGAGLHLLDKILHIPSTARPS